MTSLGQRLVAFLCIPLMVCCLNRTDTMEDPKCGQLVDTKALAYCCGMTLLDKFQFVGSNCTEYWDDYGPCRYECLYRHWKLLDANNKVKKPELYTMITYLYNPLNGYHQYATAFKEAHSICEEKGTQHDDFVLRHASAIKEWMGLNSSCRPQAMLHAQCIMVHLTYNCPKVNWRAVEQCEALRKLVPECVIELEVGEVFRPADKALPKEKSTRGSAGIVLSGYLVLVSSLLSAVLATMLSGVSPIDCGSHHLSS